jgi:AraC-like DNA-binding protein
VIVPTVLASTVNGLAAFVSARGIVYDDLLRRAGFQPPELADPDQRVSMQQVCDLFELAAEMTGDPEFGLHFGRAYRTGEAGALSFAVLSAGEAAAALATVARFSAAHVDLEQVRLEPGGAAAQLEWAFPRALHRHRQFAEFLVVTVVERMRLVLGEDWAPREVDLSHAAPADDGEHRRLLGPRVRFGQPINAVHVTRKLLSRPIPAFDHHLNRLTEEFRRQAVARRGVESEFSAEVRARIAVALVAGEPTLGDVAGRLDIAPSELQQRLAGEGLGFGRLVDQTRQTMAETYLTRTPMPLSHIAFLLGYDQVNNFHRAARAWFGVSPREFRKPKAG